MISISNFDFGQRQREKQASRAQDESDLNQGRSPQDISANNGAFSMMDVANSSIRRRRPIAA